MIKQRRDENVKRKLKVNTNNIYHRPIYHGLKRLFDVIICTIALICLSWLYLLIAILIKIDDPHSPVFYVQTRIGQYGRPFRIYKFRSMIPHAAAKKRKLLRYNDVKGAMFKMHDDPRVTPIGHFIRRHSIDELPQLLNVLEGDMALVGPRPPLPNEVAKYSEHDKQRLMVVPGCTGAWQVNGRNALSFEQMVNLDILYINNSTFWDDFKIIVKTIWIMLIPHNAY